MPVNTTHPQYDHAKFKWRRVRDAIGGCDSVHASGELYLPRLTGQTDMEYLAYVKRAGWYGATARTIDAMHGLVFRKPPVIKGPQELLDDITMTGKSAADLASDIVRQVLEVGRVGVLVDFATVDDDEVSNAAQAAAKGLRAYASLYNTEAIINWKEERINGSMQLTMVVLQEQFEDEAKEEAQPDPFKVELAIQYRALMLDDEAGVYKQRIYRESKDGWYIHQETIPLMNGKPMAAIPFVIVTNEHIGSAVTDPPMIDLVDMNLSHYRTSADLEHGAHFTGLPTAIVSGYQKIDNAEVLAIGSTNAWVFPDPQAKASYLEFQGTGLGALEKMLDRKESLMGRLGARMLMDQARGHAESAQALEIRSAGETSVLGAVAVLAGRAISKVLNIAAAWNGTAADCACELNTEYALTSMDPQKISALVAAWQSGAISHRTLFWNLKQGETVADSTEFEEEKAEIEEEGPNLMGQAVAMPKAKAPAPAAD